MKRFFFICLFFIIIIGLYGQTRPENRWILGRWIGTDYDGDRLELVLNDNGTGKWNNSNIFFSIVGETITIFYENSYRGSIYHIRKINDQRMFLTMSFGTGTPTEANIRANLSKSN